MIIKAFSKRNSYIDIIIIMPLEVVEPLFTIEVLEDIWSHYNALVL